MGHLDHPLLGGADMSLLRQTHNLDGPLQRRFWPLVTDRIGGAEITHYPWHEDPDCTAKTPFYYSSDAIHLPTNYQIVVL